MRKPVSGVMLTLLLIGMLALSFNVQPVKASGTIYIRADGSIDPPDAPISTVNNVTYTLTGNITNITINADGIVVERSHIIIDGAGYTVEGAGIGGGSGFFLSGITNVTIKNTNIKHFWAGIWLQNSNNNTIAGNNITNNTEYGISLFWGSSNNIISGNNITNIGYGIVLYRSSNNVLRDNAMVDNAYNFCVKDHFVNDVDSSNTVDGKPIYYWVNMRDLSVPLDAGYVALVNCTNIIAENLSLMNNGEGMLLVHTTNSTIAQNNITNNEDGVYLYDSSNNNIICGNNITTNNMDGIHLEYSTNNNIYGNNITAKWVSIYLSHSSNNTIFGNNITSNTDGVYLEYSSNNDIYGNNIQASIYYYSMAFVYSSNNNIYVNNMTNSGVGIYLGGSSNNDIYGNNITDNTEGIRLFSSSNNTIVGNNITENNRYGIWLYSSSNYNSISGNNITANNVDGIRLEGSSDNIIYYNNFIHNARQVYSYTSVNIWDDGYPSGGNYWSDYVVTANDTYSGSFQDETGSDGISDEPYVIDANNTDHYPLMGMFSDFNATSEHVQTICNSSISDFQFNGTAISFNVSGENGTTCFCRICVPTTLMNNTYKVFVNGTEVLHTLLPCSNSTHSYLYFTYEHSTQEVVIIPEFPSVIILPLFILATLIVAITLKKKRKTKPLPTFSLK